MKPCLKQQISWWRCAVRAGLCLMVVACARFEPKPVKLDVVDKMEPQQILEKEKQIRPPGPPPFQEKLAPIAKGVKEDTRLYTLLFDDAPLGDVLGALTADADYNLTVESGVDLSRTVRVHLKNVTLTEALDMVVDKGAGYAWDLEGGFLFIKRFAETIYHFDYLDLNGETDIEIGGDLLATAIEDAGVTGKFQFKAKRSAEITDIWKDVQVALESLKSPDGRLRINRNAGIIYMADMPKRIATMTRFLDSLSESLHRQVFIEAKIMEVFLDDDHKYGIDWTQADIRFTKDFGILPDEFQLNVNAGSTVALANISNFEAVVDFLETQGEVSVLSNPHISVLNGRSAVFTVGFQFPFGDISGVDQDFDTDVITFRSSIKRVVLGLQFGITPQISKDGTITINIVPTLTRIERIIDVEFPTTGTEEQTIANPVIDLQELTTTVRVREGKSVVLAGLITQLRNLEHEGLPWLRKLPFLDGVFGRVNEELESSELVIVLTPYIKTVG